MLRCRKPGREPGPVYASSGRVWGNVARIAGDDTGGFMNVVPRAARPWEAIIPKSKTSVLIRSHTIRLQIVLLATHPPKLIHAIHRIGEIMVPASDLESFRSTLFSGSYNFLSGFGISRGSRNHAGIELLGAEGLRQHLCALTGARANTMLTRVYQLLTPAQIQTEIVERYQGCQPSAALQFVDSYLWRRHFTFNVDDVLEKKYRRGSFQTLVPINFDEPFQPTPDRSRLQVIHLHGWVGRPASGFVFSNSEYARNMGSMNPWMHSLAEILATEPFIIVGTSLNEMDLEYYLSYRTQSTPRRGLGPSLLIEPDPDTTTVADCARYGLTLVKATFGEFLDWLHLQFPSPPTISDLVIPDAGTLFHPTITQRDKLDFFMNFDLVSASDVPLPNTPSPFMSGREPDWGEIDRHYDIERSANASLATDVQRSLKDPTLPRLRIVATEAGTGKTTTSALSS